MVHFIIIKCYILTDRKNKCKRFMGIIGYLDDTQSVFASILIELVIRISIKWRFKLLFIDSHTVWYRTVDCCFSFFFI